MKNMCCLGVLAGLLALSDAVACDCHPAVVVRCRPVVSYEPAARSLPVVSLPVAYREPRPVVIVVQQIAPAPQVVYSVPTPTYQPIYSPPPVWYYSPPPVYSGYSYSYSYGGYGGYATSPYSGFYGTPAYRSR